MRRHLCSAGGEAEQQVAGRCLSPAARRLSRTGYASMMTHQWCGCRRVPPRAQAATRPTTCTGKFEPNLQTSQQTVSQCAPPMVREPAGSTSRASCSASDVARSALAGVTASMMALSPCRVRHKPLPGCLQASVYQQCALQASAG